MLGLFIFAMMIVICVMIVTYSVGTSYENSMSPDEILAEARRKKGLIP